MSESCPWKDQLSAGVSPTRLTVDFDMKTHCPQLSAAVTRGWGGAWADWYDGKQVWNAGPGGERGREGRLGAVGSDPAVAGA